MKASDMMTFDELKEWQLAWQKETFAMHELAKDCRSDGAKELDGDIAEDERVGFERCVEGVWRRDGGDVLSLPLA